MFFCKPLTVSFFIQIKKKSCEKFRHNFQNHNFLPKKKWKICHSSKIKILIIFLTFSFLPEKIVSSMQKKTALKSEQYFWRYCTLKKKNHCSFLTLGFWKPSFDRWGHKCHPIFVFFVYDFWSVIKDKAFDISKGIEPLSIWKIKIFTPFRSIVGFKEIRYRG